MYRHGFLQPLLADDFLVSAVLPGLLAVDLLLDLKDSHRDLLNIQILTIKYIDLVTGVILLHLPQPVTL